MNDRKRVNGRKANGTDAGKSNGKRSENSRAILDAFRRIVQAIQLASKAVEAELDLSGAQLFVLHKASEQGASSINELAEKTLTHQSSVSVVVDKLVSKGLVRREPDPLDRRRAQVRLTKEGRDLLRKAPQSPQEKLSQAILALTDQERRSLAQGLTKLLESAGFTKGRPPMFFENGTSKPAPGKNEITDRKRNSAKSR